MVQRAHYGPEGPTMTQRVQNYSIGQETPRGFRMAQRAGNSPECPTWQKEPRMTRRAHKKSYLNISETHFLGHFYHYDDGRRSQPLSPVQTESYWRQMWGLWICMRDSQWGHISSWWCWSYQWWGWRWCWCLSLILCPCLYPILSIHVYFVKVCMHACVNNTLFKCEGCFTGFIFHVPLVASSILHAGHISTLLTVATSNYFTYILCNYHEIFLLWIRVPAKTDCYNIASPGPKFWWEHGGVAWWALVSTFLVTTSSLRIITLECLLAELFATPCFHYYHLKRNYCACSSFERE